MPELNGGVFKRIAFLVEFIPIQVRKPDNPGVSSRVVPACPLSWSAVMVFLALIPVILIVAGFVYSHPEFYSRTNQPPTREPGSEPIPTA